jgi:hypothetical protein
LLRILTSIYVEQYAYENPKNQGQNLSPNSGTTVQEANTPTTTHTPSHTHPLSRTPLRPQIRPHTPSLSLSYYDYNRVAYSQMPTMVRETNTSSSDKGWMDKLPPGVDSFSRCIDEDWDYPGIDLADASTERINGYLLWIIISYRRRAYTDIKLWECFKEDFEGWTIDTWSQANTTIVREFRDFLRRNGLYVPKNGASIRSNIQAILDSPEEPEWTQEEIQRQINSEPRTNQFSNEGSFNSKLNPRQRDGVVHAPPARPLHVPTPPTNTPPTTTETLSERKPLSVDVSPVLPVHNIYSNEAVSQPGNTFEAVCSQLRSAVGKTTLQRVINDNPTKSRSKCLQLPFDSLQKIQRGLPNQSENALRDQIISAYRGIPECSLALFQPGKTFEAVCSQLRSDVGTAIRSQEARAQEGQQSQLVTTQERESDEVWKPPSTCL